MMWKKVDFRPLYLIDVITESEYKIITPYLEYLKGMFTEEFCYEYSVMWAMAKDREIFFGFNENNSQVYNFIPFKTFIRQYKIKKSLED